MVEPPPTMSRTEPDPFDAARRRAHELIEAAVKRLTAAGMVVRYRSTGGVSWYLGLPGRSGTLRVSDHASPDPDRSDVVARITFGPNSLPASEDKIMDLIAIGFGRYVLKTGGMVPATPGQEASDV